MTEFPSLLLARKYLPMLAGGILTLVMMASIARQLGAQQAALGRIAPASLPYYGALLLGYLALPFGDYVIFRRLWKIPREGLSALLKKQIANEVLIGYSGEALFYAWAKRRGDAIATPFGAVKDVMITSALAGNTVTVLLVALALPFAISLLNLEQLHGVLTAVAIVGLATLPYLLLSKRIFTLGRETLWWVFKVHGFRQATEALLVVTAWHFALPEVSLGSWLALAAARMLVSRLPLVPNKELLFANFAVVLLGTGNNLVALLAFTAALTLAAHFLLIAGFAIAAVVNRISQPLRGFGLPARA